MGIDPNLAFMGVIVVAVAGLGFSIHAVRDILVKLAEAQRTADGAWKEYRLALEEYRYEREQYERVKREAPFTVVRPGKRKPAVKPEKIDWKGAADG